MTFELPSTARARKGVAKPYGVEVEQGQIAPSMRVERGIGRTEVPEIKGVAAENHLAREVEKEPVTGEKLRETLQEKLDKVEALRNRAGDLIDQIQDKERVESARQEAMRLDAITGEFDDSMTEDQKFIVGLKRIDETRADLELYNWTEFVMKLEGKVQTEEEIKQNPELTALGKNWDLAWGKVKDDLAWYDRRAGEDRADKLAKREWLTKTVLQ